MNYQYPPLDEEYEFQEFLKDFFNCHYKTDSFESYRTKGAAQYGIDVYSSRLHIAVQAKKKKLSRSEPTLIKELLNDVEETAAEIQHFPFPVACAIIASTTKKFSAVQDACIRHSQNGTLSFQFWSWDDIQKEIAGCGDLQRKYYPTIGRPVIPKELVPTSQVDITQILGREEVVEVIKRRLAEKRMLCLQSVGGVGKTTTAKLFYQRSSDAYDHQLWLDHVTDFKKDLAFHSVLQASLQLDELPEDGLEKRYHLVLQALLAIPGKTLLVIDNLHHEAKGSVEGEIRKFIAKTDLHILITSRQHFGGFPTYELPNLSLPAARQLFDLHCPKQIDRSNLDRLLEQIGRNALVTELTAKTIYNGLGLTVEGMMARFEEGDIETDDLDIDIEQVDGGGIIHARLHQQIAKIFHLGVLKDKYQSYLVLCLSLLPATPIPITEVFEFYLYNEKNRAPIINSINELHKRGLLMRSGDAVSMHHSIQDVVRMQMPDYMSYIGILNSLLRSLDKANKTFSQKGYKLQQHAVAVLSKLKGRKAASVQQPLTMLRNNLFIALRYLGEKEKAAQMGKELLEALPHMEALDYRDKLFLATLYHNIATFFKDQDNTDEAEKYLKKAVSTIGNEFTPNTIHFYNALYAIYHEQGKDEEALACCEKALELLQKPEAKGYDHLLAMVTNSIAMANLKLGSLENAASFILHAIKIHRMADSEEKNPAALAAYYSNGALIYSLAENHEMAIQFALHAIKYQASLQLENDQELVGHYKRAAQVYEAAGEREKAAAFRTLLERAETVSDYRHE